jgi:hypothetical protein
VQRDCDPAGERSSVAVGDSCDRFDCWIALVAGRSDRPTATANGSPLPLDHRRSKLRRGLVRFAHETGRGSLRASLARWRSLGPVLTSSGPGRAVGPFRSTGRSEIFRTSRELCSRSAPPEEIPTRSRYPCGPPRRAMARSSRAERARARKSQPAQRQRAGPSSGVASPGAGEPPSAASARGPSSGTSEAT